MGELKNHPKNVVVLGGTRGGGRGGSDAEDRESGSSSS